MDLQSTLVSLVLSTIRQTLEATHTGIVWAQMETLSLVTHTTTIITAIQQADNVEQPETHVSLVHLSKSQILLVTITGTAMVQMEDTTNSVVSQQHTIITTTRHLVVTNQNLSTTLTTPIIMDVGLVMQDTDSALTDTHVSTNHIRIKKEKSPQIRAFFLQKIG